jgi:hypothetical protein
VSTPAASSILSRIRPASAIPTTPKILLVGDHGSGKTHTMATFHSPRQKMLAAVFEGSQSVATIQQAAPDCGIFRVNNVGDWKDLCRYMLSGDIEQDGFGMLGIDSFTEMQMYYDRDFELVKKAANKGNSNPKENKWDKFRSLKTSMSNIFLFTRDLPIPVAATVRGKPETDEDSGVTSVRIALDGSVRFDLGAYFSATAFVYKIDTDEKGNNRRGAMFSGSPTYPCRELGPLRGVGVPNGALWMRALAGENVDGLYLENVRLPDERKRSSSQVNQDVAV